MKNYQKIYEERFAKLNKKQQEAVLATDGPVMVIAGPGTGKTELLSMRTANILKEGLARPESILCLTFTDVASRNMRDRLLSIIGPEAHKVQIFTFHSFCTNIIAKYSQYFFNAINFEAVGELKQNEILENIFKGLDYKNPLYSYHEKNGFTYFKNIKKIIGDIKQAGLSVSDFKNKLEKNKKELEILREIVFQYLPEDMRSNANKEKFFTFLEMIKESGTELGDIYYKKITEEMENGLTPGKAKDKIIEKKPDDNKLYFKDDLRQDKMFALLDIYEKYQKALYDEAFFDFNDMIIFVKNELKNNIVLRAEVEEEYQYIMIDEFQDTNGAQLDLVKSITQNPVLEGKANIFIVGDDDQSVYKFQGADLNNIFDFENTYTDVRTIVLTENYRSSQKILDFSKEIINNGKNRLENKYTHLDKKLFAKNENIIKEKSNIFVKGFNNQEEEYSFVAQEIKKLIDEKISPKEIAIISRNHNQLQTIQTYLDTEKVFYNYERKESVFDQIHIRELIIICKYLETVVNNVVDEDDELLSQILSFQFLEIDRIEIWNIALQANKMKKENKECSWLMIMTQSPVEKIREFAEFLIELAIISKEEPLEIILDIIIGSKGADIAAENEYEDAEENDLYKNSGLKLKTKYISNYKEYYFGKIVSENNLAKYIHFLSSLKVFISALREYKKGEILYVKDLSKFVELHKDYEVALLNKTTFANNENAVQLLTAHKSKGLEFTYVFLISSNQNIWSKSKGNHDKISFPKNMNYKRMADDEDDFLRIFFVALTRAKNHIYITHTENKFAYLENIDENKLDRINEENTNYKNNILNGLQIYHIPPFANDEKVLLQKIIENYKMPVTHLNNFLDLSKGGPKLFLEQNLLRFPQSKTVSSVYGSAIHKAIEMMYVLTEKNKKIENVEYFIDIFNKEIKKGRLLKRDERDQLTKGEENIKLFYKNNKDKILNSAVYSQTEVDFKDQNVVLHNILNDEYKDTYLTGKIDRIEEIENELNVIDLKSGKAMNKFELGKAKEEDYDNIKKINYKHQLMFYKILLENSRNYNNKKINNGILQFVDSPKEEELILDFNNPEDFTYEEYQDFKKLIVIIYNKIINLNFTNIDISKYSADSEGILEFKKDLLSGV